jgi:hypothetical protein
MMENRTVQKNAHEKSRGFRHRLFSGPGEPGLSVLGLSFYSGWAVLTSPSILQAFALERAVAFGKIAQVGVFTPKFRHGGSHSCHEHGADQASKNNHRHVHMHSFLDG